MNGAASLRTPRSRLPAAVGDVIDGKYVVESILGVGGMGVVLGAVHLSLNQPVALKFLLPEAAVEDIARVRFDREARALAQLESEHVARVMDVAALPDGTPYIVLERLDGRDLADVLDARGALPIDEAVDHILEACDAIAEAHALGIIHRDLKPENLFLTDRADGTHLVKVIDFGISKVTENSLAFSAGRDSAVTRTANVVGSPMYMPPEQLRSAREVDGRSDVWSLAVTLYELLSAQAPFPWGTVPEVCAAVLKDEPVPLRERRADVPPELDAAIGHALEKDPERRWPDIAAFAAAIAPFGGPRAAGLLQRIDRVSRRCPRRRQLSSDPAWSSLVTLEVERPPPARRSSAPSHPVLGSTPPVASAPQPSLPELPGAEIDPRVTRSTRRSRFGAVLAAVGVAVLALGLASRATTPAPAPALASRVGPLATWIARSTAGRAGLVEPAPADVAIAASTSTAPQAEPPRVRVPERRPLSSSASSHAFEYRK